MKTKRLLIFCLALFSYVSLAISTEQFRKEFLEISKNQEFRINTCLKQNETIKNGYKELEIQDKNGVTLQLSKSEEETLGLLMSFRPELTFSTSINDYFQLIQNNCSEDNLKVYSELERKRVDCMSIIDELYFMRSIIYATRNNHWKKNSIERARKLILNYVQFQVNIKEAPPITQMISASILKDMIDYGLIDIKLKKEIVAIQKEGEKYQRNLKKEIREGLKKGMQLKNSCEAFRKFIKGESASGLLLNGKLKKVLSKLF